MQILRDLDALAWLLTSSYPKIGLVRKPSKPLASSSSTTARPIAIIRATAAWTKRGLVVGAVGSLPP